VRQLYAAKGFEGDLLNRIVERITEDPDVWVAVMMAEEHHLAPVSRRRSVSAALTVGAASLIGSVLPLLPFALPQLTLAIALSVAIAAVTLFAMGALKARATVGSPIRSGLQLLLIGLASAALAYCAGRVFEAKSPP
jgi:predicted membrane protein (TIGR00267 family)